MSFSTGECVSLYSIIERECPSLKRKRISFSIKKENVFLYTQNQECLEWVQTRKKESKRERQFFCILVSLFCNICNSLSWVGIFCISKRNIFFSRMSRVSVEWKRMSFWMCVQKKEGVLLLECLSLYSFMCVSPPKEFYKYEHKTYEYAKETYEYAKETFRYAKETYKYARETHEHANKTYKCANETYENAKKDKRICKRDLRICKRDKRIYKRDL